MILFTIRIRIRLKRGFKILNVWLLYVQTIISYTFENQFHPINTHYSNSYATKSCERCRTFTFQAPSNNNTHHSTMKTSKNSLPFSNKPIQSRDISPNENF